MKKQIISVFVLIVFVALAACAPAAAPTAPAPTQAPAATAVPIVKMRTAYSFLNPDATPAWIAKDAGFFEKNGLDMELIFIDGGTRHAQALISKDVSIGLSSGAPAVSGAAAGADLVIIAGLVNRPNYDFVVHPGIKSGADLKGKKVAVSDLSGSSYVATRIALRELFKLDPDKDVTYVPIGAEPEREAALISKQTDGTVLAPDISIQAKKDGLVVLDSLWNKPIAYQHSAIVSTRSYLKDNAEIATRYLKSIIQAIGYFKDPANKANSIKIMSKYLKIDDQELLESAYVRYTTTIFQCAPYVTVEGVKTVIDNTKQAVTAGLTTQQVVDNSLVKALDDSGFVKANCK